MNKTDPSFGSRVGGRLCLDFVNTVRGRVGGTARGTRDFADHVLGERIDSYDALLRWGTFVGVLSSRDAKTLAREAASKPAEAAAVLKRALTVREAIYRVFKSAVEGWPPPPGDLAAINRELQRSRAHEQLVASPTIRWDWQDTVSLDQVLWPVMRSAAELLTSPELERVGQCPGDECGWLFLDTSRSRRRQWCEMAECGNLAKVRRFRERRRATP